MTAVCSATAMAAEGAPIPPHTATYDVLRHGSKIGELDVGLEQLENGVWHYRSDTRATAWWARVLDVSAEEAAHFVWRDGRIMMLTYHHAQRIPGDNRYFQHRTDWDAGTTEIRTEEVSKTVELTPDMVDPLSLRLQLAVELADPARREATHRFTLLDRDEVKRKHYRFDGRERLETPAGCFDTVRIRRIEEADSDKTNLSWHAADFHWMPVRILRRRDGKDRFDIRLAETDLPLDECPRSMQ
jgi:hypothetical protein